MSEREPSQADDIILGISKLDFAYGQSYHRTSLSFPEVEGVVKR
jgi:hypothetical protein